MARLDDGFILYISNGLIPAVVFVVMGNTIFRASGWVWAALVVVPLWPGAKATAAPSTQALIPVETAMVSANQQLAQAPDSMDDAPGGPE